MNETLRQDLSNIYDNLTKKDTLVKEILIGFLKCEDLIKEDQSMKEYLGNSKSILSFFIPLSNESIQSNDNKTFIPSRQIIDTYKHALNIKVQFIQEVSTFLTTKGYIIYDTNEKLDLDEIAYLSGLGNFGMHTSLITKAGACGCLFSLLTNIELESDAKYTKPTCIYKATGRACLDCFRACQLHALSFDGLDKSVCGKHALDNLEDIDINSDICFKCLSNTPCGCEDPLDR